MTKDEAPIKGEGMISDPDEYDWKCGCALCEVRYKNWKSDYDVQQAALRNEALDKKAENARELGLDYEPDYKVTVVDDQHPKGVPLEQWGRSAPVQEPFCFFYVENGEEYFAPKGAYVPDNAQPLYTTPPASPVRDEHQAFIDSLPKDGEDKMFMQIDHWARQSYKRHKSLICGHMITAADAYDSHIIWATLRWAKENTPPAQRTWAGLTDDDIITAYETSGHKQAIRPQDVFAVAALARAVEARLKEKNT